MSDLIELIGSCPKCGGVVGVWKSTSELRRCDCDIDDDWTEEYMRHTELGQIEKILDGTIECQIEGGFRLHDDHDGTCKGHLWVQVGPDGHAWVNVVSDKGLRFRSYEGGGRSLRVYNALLILAHAIEMDNKDKPDPRP